MYKKYMSSIIPTLFIFLGSITPSLSQTSKEDTRVRLGGGCGMGPLFASIGFSLEVQPLGFASAFASYGLGPTRTSGEYQVWDVFDQIGKREDWTYCAGVRFYPNYFTKLNLYIFEPRLGLSYGYNGLALNKYYVMDVPVYTSSFMHGFNVSAGLRIEPLKNFCIEYDLMFVLTRSGGSTYSGMALKNFAENKDVVGNFGFRYFFSF